MEEIYFEKKENNVGWIVFIIICISLLFLFYSLENSSPSETYTYLTEKTVLIGEEFSDIDLPHFTEFPITYSYADTCIGPIVPRIEWAFEILENDTEQLLSFEQVIGNADIKFICNPDVRVEGDSYTDITSIIFGETEILEYEGSVIEKTQIEFWGVKENTRPPACQKFPNLEVHEILHAFGLDHEYGNRYSIMASLGSECIAKDTPITLHSTGETFIPEDKVDDNIISCLKYIYSNGEKGGLCEKVKFQL